MFAPGRHCGRGTGLTGLTCSPSGVTTATLPAVALGADTGCSSTLHASSPVRSERALSLQRSDTSAKRSGVGVWGTQRGTQW